MKRPARGFAMVTAIFVMGVLAVLGGLMLSLSNTQQLASARDVLGSRAYYAARTGIEWGAYRAVQASTCSPPTTLPAAAAPGFAVQVTCSSSGPFYEGGTPVTLYQITATATTGTLGASNHVERQLQAVVSRP